MNWFTWNYFIPLANYYPHYYFIGNKENDGDWHNVSSYEEVAFLIRYYETTTVIKFACYSSDKNVEDIGKLNLWNITSEGFSFGSVSKAQNS